ncbi:hypothetical protein Nepgr_010672 [Nepenthes gracilis]|uniref:Uncharacterized protein n=1 Tax=Nepenthes gracilis TaxID=150966 RepID=A0AAD3XLA2_NEPGR|nr:hypothetical protein Nepgr_010672 [Nepenthes gracilis]
MGYLLRVRLTSFFIGAATASLAGLFILYKDYKFAHESISDQMKRLHDSLDKRISSLEKLNEDEVSQRSEATE